MTPPSSSPPPRRDGPAAEASSPVRLSGWRLWLAWGVVAVVGAWALILNGRAIPIVWEMQFVAAPTFHAFHVNAWWQADVSVVAMRGGVAEQAGLPSGRLLVIGGEPLREGTTVIEAARRLPETVGDSVRLTVATAKGDTVSASVVRTSDRAPELAEARMTYVGFGIYRQFMWMLLWGGMLATAIALLVRRGRSLVALFGAVGFLSQLGSAPFVEVARDLVGGFFGSGAMDSLAGIGLILFLAVFPDGRMRPRWVGILVAVVLVRAVVMFQLPDSDARDLVRFLGVIPFMLAIVAQAVRYRRYASPSERLQMKWALLGTSIGFAMATAGLLLMTFLDPPIGTAAYWWTVTAMVTLLSGFVFVPLGVLVALLRYRLWDVESAWSKSAMAAALTLALTAIVAGGTALTQSALGASGPMALGLATGAAAFVFVPLQRRLSDWADHRFLRDLTDLKTKLPQLVSHLRETESIEGIAEAVTDRVLPAVHATHVALVVPTDEGWEAVGTEGVSREAATAWAATAGLSTPPDLAGTRRQPWRAIVWREASDRQFPVRVALRAERGGGEMTTEGWLLLGPRPDGSGYGPDDLEAVAEVAGPVGRALRVVRTREERQETAAREYYILEEAVRDLEAELMRLREKLAR